MLFLLYSDRTETMWSVRVCLPDSDRTDRSNLCLVQNLKTLVVMYNIYGK